MKVRQNVKQTNKLEETSPVVHADNIDVYINTVCNLKCPTCFLGDDYFNKNIEMSPEKFGSILEWAESQGIRDIAILGGEPTLHSRFTEIAAMPRKYNFTRVRVITNGNSRFRNLFPKVRDWIDYVYVSLDASVKDVNDDVRGRGAFDDACASIDLLKRAGHPFTITSTVSRPTLPYFEDLLGFADGSGCEVLNVHWLSTMGRAKGGALKVSAEEWLACVEQARLYESVRENFKIDFQAAFVRRKSSSIVPNMCLVRSVKNLQFMPDDRVISCGLLADDYQLHGYEWRNGALFNRPGETEVELCRSFTGDGCPLRQGMIPHLSSNDVDFVPVCIYYRPTL